MRAKLATMGTVLALAAAAAGCGGEGADSSGAAPPPAPEALQSRFAAQANALCERARLRDERKAVAVFRSKAKLYERNGTFNAYKGSLRRQEIAIVLAPSLRRRLAAVRDLRVPQGDERTLEEVLGALDAAAKSATEGPAGFLESGGMGEARQLAAAAGIDSCAVLYDPEGVFQSASAKPGARLAPRSSK
jgi:hypothetical protein